MRRAVFLIHGGLSAILIAVSLFCLAMPVVMPQNPGAAGAFLGGIFGFLTFAVWGSLEWRAYIRSDAPSERHAAFCSAVFGGVILFTAVGMLVDLVNGRPVPDDTKWIVSAFSAAAAWFILTSASRLRRLTRIETAAEPGSPVEQSPPGD